MRLPRGERAQFFRVVHCVEVSEEFPQFVHGIGWNAFKAALRIEPLQSLMDKASYFHRMTVARSLTLINAKNVAHVSATTVYLFWRSFRPVGSTDVPELR